ncbi:MAG: hypothetical protein J7L89_06985 [Bacteroidales bacterium]|nr:hypothetical protein [Bacteroidales bacterium]
MKQLILILLTCSMFTNSPAQELKPVPLKRYLEYARKAADQTWEQRDSIVARWRRNIDPENIFGYRSPGGLVEMAAIYATLYDIEGHKKYGVRAKKILLTYGDYRSAFTVKGSRRQADYADGIPVLPDFFSAMRYLRAYDILKTKNLFTPAETQKIDDQIAHSLRFILRTQEWGPMNRSALRAETLSWAVRVLPHHEVTPTLKTLEQVLVSDNWGQWEIEDATLYHAVWLYAMLGCADARNQITELFQTPEIYYYTHYFLHLMSPLEMIPDFGDAHHLQNWNRWLVVFEAAAKAYHDPEMKWAATVISNHFVDFNKKPGIGLAYQLLDCYRFGTDELKPHPPKQLSEEVMEDVVGKKIVFRDGWDPRSTYMLENYRDEGDGGLIYRDYLRANIPIEEEKVTHGHSDENSIALLMYRGATLLCDGGYRDFLPSGYWGAYRQDYFHNRLCVRNEKIWFGQQAGAYRYSQSDHPAIESQSILDFMHNAGSYRKVHTQKIDFLSFADHDYSRTRVTDEVMGYEWDRTIVYIKDPVMFVVFDVFKSRSEQYFTAANFWHTRQIIRQGPHWYDTHYDSVGRLPVPDGQNLLICFPKNHYRFEQVHPENRNYHQEIAITEFTGQFFEPGQHTGLVTVLIPHDADTAPDSWVKAIRYIESDRQEDGMSVEITLGDRVIRTGIKCDLKKDWVRDDQRPKYTWEAGRIRYGDIETNADFFFTDRTGNQLSYTMVNLTRATWKNQVLYQQPSSFYGLNFDGRPDQPGVGKARLCRETRKLK